MYVNTFIHVNFFINNIKDYSLAHYSLHYPLKY